jgi:hypothetical protein
MFGQGPASDAAKWLALAFIEYLPPCFGRAGNIVGFMPAEPLALDDNDPMIEAARSGVALAHVWEGRAQPYLRSVN